ncbi:MAG: hypothetical protein ABFS32_13750 [Bacteroidota bacterium]
MQSFKYKPVIVVVAYNRPGSLERILSSLKRMKNASDVRLVVSIDHKAPHNYDVLEIAKKFDWPFGEKEVLYQEESLGLRRHIMQCADLSQEFGSVIILEDDLYVSPYFYQYACEALDFYDEDPEIAGISLYNQAIEEVTELPFTPVSDESDIYFLQHPSSWGQAWTSSQWSRFREWYQTDPDLFKIAMSDPIRRYWPETSWKKYFCGYMADKKKFFVFPRISYTTNFNDPGTNYKKSVNFQGQTPLRLSEISCRFKRFSDSYCVYDSHLELLPECLKQLSSGFDNFEFELDLYGVKDMASLNVPYVITTKPCSSHERGYRRALKPHEMNLIFELPGDDIHLAKKEDVQRVRNRHSRTIDNFKYYYTRNILGWKVQMYNYYLKLMERIK